MEWISVKDKHFVDIENFDDGSYTWEENENCPKSPFLVGLHIRRIDKVEFDYFLVILGSKGLEEWTEDENFPLYWNVNEIEFWCEIKKPTL